MNSQQNLNEAGELDRGTNLTNIRSVVKLEKSLYRVSGGTIATVKSCGSDVANDYSGLSLPRQYGMYGKWRGEAWGWWLTKLRNISS